MTIEEKIAILKRNIKVAEERASREAAAGNDFGVRSNMQFAEECRAELRAVSA